MRLSFIFNKWGRLIIYLDCTIVIRLVKLILSYFTTFPADRPVVSMLTYTNTQTFRQLAGIHTNFVQFWYLLKTSFLKMKAPFQWILPKWSNRWGVGHLIHWSFISVYFPLAFSTSSTLFFGQKGSRKFLVRVTCNILIWTQRMCGSGSIPDGLETRLHPCWIQQISVGKKHRVIFWL